MLKFDPFDKSMRNLATRELNDAGVHANDLSEGMLTAYMPMFLSSMIAKDEFLLENSMAQVNSASTAPYRTAFMVLVNKAEGRLRDLRLLAQHYEDQEGA